MINNFSLDLNKNIYFKIGIRNEKQEYEQCYYKDYLQTPST